MGLPAAALDAPTEARIARGVREKRGASVLAAAHRERAQGSKLPASSCASPRTARRPHGKGELRLKGAPPCLEAPGGA